MNVVHLRLDLLTVSDNFGGINPSGPFFFAASSLSANNSLIALNIKIIFLS